MEKLSRDALLDTRNSLLKTLTEKVCSVTFTKIDGTERTLRCTLNSKFLPPPKPVDPAAPPKPPKKPNEEVLTVWDVDVSMWKSFRVENVKNIV